MVYEYCVPWLAWDNCHFNLLVSALFCSYLTCIHSTKSIAVSIMLFNRGNQQFLGIWSSAQEKKEKTCLEAKNLCCFKIWLIVLALSLISGSFDD